MTAVQERPPLLAEPEPVTDRRATLVDLFRFVGAQRGFVGVVLGLSVLTAVTTLAQPALVGRVLERVAEAEPVGRLLWVLGAVVVAGGVLSGVQHYLVQRTAEGAVRTSRRQLVAHLLRLPIAELDRRRTGDLVSRVAHDTSVVRAALTQGFVESIAGVFTLVGAMGAMLFLDPMLLGVAFVVALVAVACVAAVTQQLERSSHGLQRAVGELGTATDRALRRGRTVRAANATEAETARVVARVDRTWKVGVDVAWVTALVAPLSSMATQVCFLTVLGLGGWRVATEHLTVAELVQFILYLFLLILPLGRIVSTVGAVGEALGGLTRIRELLDVPEEDDRATRLAFAGARPNPELALVLDNVSFRYDDGPAVLDRLTFAVRRGQRVAVVGPSGAGKSTLLNVIVRLYDPVAGVVRVDGQDVRERSRSQVRAGVGYVEQDAPVLAGTLRDNLTFAVPATDDECRRALADVNLLDVLDRSPAGLDAQVGEGGVMLSGGERQRLALARALLARPTTLLLDESTSHLDGLNEALVRDLIDRVAAGCTLVVVAHRLSTVVDSDVILVMDRGRLVAQGTHDELVRTSRLYRELARTQLVR